MSSGVLGQLTSSPSNTADSILYTVPGLTLATVNIHICNQNISPDAVFVALVNGIGPPQTYEYIEYLYDLPASQSYQITALVLQAGYSIMVGSKEGGSSFVAVGIEQALA